MYKKLIKTVCLCLILLCLTLTFVGCDSNSDCIEYKQITMAQIEDALMNDKNVPTIDSSANMISIEDMLLDETIISVKMVAWQREFERHNIDSRNFMAMDKYRYTAAYTSDDGVMTKNFLVHIFKFVDTDSASNCYKNLSFIKDSSFKQYGNLIVLCDNAVAEYVFSVINGLEV
jgi:hypothetical protein